METVNRKPVAVVTGGASGIGQACARQLAKRGWHVVIADVRQEAAQQAAREIDAEAIVYDVADEAATQNAAAFCEERFGSVTALITSAGVIQQPLDTEHFVMSDFDRIMSINVRGTYLSCVAFGNRMARRGVGGIVTIGSITALRSAPLHAYAPSKAAVVHMTQCLAAEWARSGVRVNAISPGYVATPPLREAIQKGQRDPNALIEGAAMHRMVEPEEIARVAAFLLSDDASAITGVNLPVDAGWLVGAHLATYGGVPTTKSSI